MALLFPFAFEPVLADMLNSRDLAKAAAAPQLNESAGGWTMSMPIPGAQAKARRARPPRARARAPACLVQENVFSATFHRLPGRQRQRRDERERPGHAAHHGGGHARRLGWRRRFHEARAAAARCCGRGQHEGQLHPRPAAGGAAAQAAQERGGGGVLRAACRRRRCARRGCGCEARRGAAGGRRGGAGGGGGRHGAGAGPVRLRGAAAPADTGKRWTSAMRSSRIFSNLLVADSLLPTRAWRRR